MRKRQLINFSCFFNLKYYICTYGSYPVCNTLGMGNKGSRNKKWLLFCGIIKNILTLIINYTENDKHIIIY